MGAIICYSCPKPKYVDSVVWVTLVGIRNSSNASSREYALSDISVSNITLGKLVDVRGFSLITFLFHVVQLMANCIRLFHFSEYLYIFSFLDFPESHF